MFLWINQPNNDSEDPAPLLDPIQMLDCIGSRPSIEIPSNDKTGRLSAIVDQLLDTYGEEAVLRRYNEALRHSAFSLANQREVQTHVYRYGRIPSLCRKLWDSGTLHSYLQSHRRRQEGGEWETWDAELMFDLIV